MKRAIKRLYRDASRLVDVSSATFTIREGGGYGGDWWWAYTATVKLNSPLMDRYDTVNSGEWPSITGARDELLRMLRMGCLPVEGTVSQ